MELRSHHIDHDIAAVGFDANCFDANSFDIDLIDNPYHAKRFLTLTLASFDGDQLAGNDEVTPVRWCEFVFVALALISSIFINNWFLRWDIQSDPATPSKILSIQLDKEQIRKSEKAVVTEPLQSLPVNTPPNTEPFEEKNSEPVVETPDVIKNETQNYNFRNQIQQVVRDQLGVDVAPDKNESLRDYTEGLSAPGLVFDNRTNNILNSPAIARLNRWRIPDDSQTEFISSGMGASINGSNARFSKIGDTCYSMSFTDSASNSPTVPLMGNGWNLKDYRKIDCSLLYLDEPVKRGDLIKRETNNGNVLD